MSMRDGGPPWQRGGPFFRLFASVGTAGWKLGKGGGRGDSVDADGSPSTTTGGWLALEAGYFGSGQEVGHRNAEATECPRLAD